MFGITSEKNNIFELRDVLTLSPCRVIVRLWCGNLEGQQKVIGVHILRSIFSYYNSVSHLVVDQLRRLECQ